MKLIVSWMVACVVIAHAACSRDSAPIAAPPAPPPAAELQDMTNLVADGASGALSDDAFRLRTLRATETELQALLGESQQRGREMEDVMAIYRELTTIRSTIELLQDQQKGLHDQVAMAALEVELVPDVAARPVVTEGWRPGSTAREALRSLLAVGRGLGDAVIFAAIVLLPLAALFTAVVTPPLLVGRAAIRRLRSRRAAA